MTVLHVYFKNSSSLFRFDFSSAVRRDSQSEATGRRVSLDCQPALLVQVKGWHRSAVALAQGKADLWSDLAGCGLLMGGTCHIPG